MKPKVYLETTIVSHLAARPSRNLIVAAHQQITHDWWDGRKDEFDLFVSHLVVDKASGDDRQAARRRMEFLEGVPLLEQTADAVALARALVERGPIPERQPEPAAHIALATVHEMHYLLTWNCSHIANAEIQSGLSETCASEGFELSHVCTPEKLMGECYPMSIRNDEIVEEVRRARHEHAARFNYDLDAIAADLREKQRQSGRKVVSLPPRRPGAPQAPRDT